MGSLFSRSEDQPTESVVVRPRDIEEWVEASGDHNPIHLDRHFATRYGYDRNFAHGLLCVAILQNRLSGAIEQTAQAGQCYLDYRFRQPVYVDEPNSIGCIRRETKQFQSEIRVGVTGEINVYMTARGSPPHVPANLDSVGDWIRGWLPNLTMHLGGLEATRLTPLNALQLLATRTYFDVFDPFSPASINPFDVELKNKEVLHLRHQVWICERRVFDTSALVGGPLDVAVWWEEPTRTDSYIFVTANITIRQGPSTLVVNKMSFRVSA